MRGLLAILVGLAAALPFVPAQAQPAVACPAVPDFSRYGAEREAVEYARAMGLAVNAREEAAGLDRTGDIAMLLMPDLAPVPANGCPEDAAEPALPAVACNMEARRALSLYLDTAIPLEQIRDVWSFLVPRAGPIPSGDPAVPLAGWRFTALTDSGLPLRYNDVPARPHIDGRRARAWQYLMNHRSGEAAMSAVSQFIQSRLADGRGEVAICPVAHAETQRLIGQLAQP